MVGWGDAKDTISDARDGPTDDDDSGSSSSGGGGGGPPEDDNDDPNPGGRFGGGPPEDDNDDNDRADRGTGRGGTSPSGPGGVGGGPPEDDNDDNDSGSSGSSGGSSGPPEDDNDDPPSEEDLDAVTPSPNPGLPSTEEPSSGGSSGSGSSGSGGSSAPPEDDNDQPDFPAPDQTPPSERPGQNIPDRDEPPEDSGSESRLDDVTPSENPGRGIEDTRTAPDEGNEARLDEVARREFEEANDPTEGVVTESDRAILRDAQGRSGPTSRQQQAIDQIVAQSDLERSDIRGVRRQESGEQVAFEPILTEQAREEQAEEQFQERRESAREEADVDAITRLGGYDVDELNFEATDDGTTVEPTDEAARENLRERAADQFDVEESEVEISDTEGGLQASVGQDDSPLDDQADEDVEPGTAANVAGEFGQEFRQNNPLFGLAVGLGAASLRTESGAAVRDPISGELRTLPGRRDVRASTERLQPASERIDAGVQSGVETAFMPVEIAAEQTDTSAADVAQNPSDALLSETVVEGTERGVTTGVQMFNPAAATRDAVRFGDLGTRAADRATREGSEEDIQRVGEAVSDAGGNAAQAAPGVLVTTAANDPARFVQAPVAGGTVLATGTAGSVALGRGLGASVRAGRRAGRRLVDSDFVSDQRGMAQIPRRQVGEVDDPDTIRGDDIAGRPDEPDQQSIRPEFERGDDVDPNSELARRRERRTDEGVDDRGRDEAFQRTMERRQRARDQPEEDLREAVDFEPVESTEDDLVPVGGESSEFVSDSQTAQRTDAEATPQEAQLVQEEVGRVEQAEQPEVTESETVSGQEEQLATGSFGETDTGQQQQQEQATQQEIEQDDLLGGFAGSDIEFTSPLAEGDEETGQPQRSEGRGREDTDSRGRTGLGNRQRQRTDTRGRQDMRTGLRTQLRLDTRLRTNFRLQGRLNRVLRTDTDRRITPRPDPEFNTNNDRRSAGFGRGLQEGAGVGVTRLVEPGWFAETVEAAGTGPTVGPRSQLAADPGNLSEVEAAGFDLATEAIADPDPGVEATGAVFGLDLDDEEEEQDEQSLGGFSGFGGYGGFNL